MFQIWYTCKYQRWEYVMKKRGAWKSEICTIFYLGKRMVHDKTQDPLEIIIYGKYLHNIWQ